MHIIAHFCAIKAKLIVILFVISHINLKSVQYGYKNSRKIGGSCSTAFCA